MVSSIGSNPLQQLLGQLITKKDANGDGKLDGGEIQSLLDTLQGGSGTSSATGGTAANQVVAALDTDGDGAVSGSEFDAGFKKLAQDVQGSLLSLQEDGAAQGNAAGVQGAGHHRHHHGGHGGDALSQLLGTSDDSDDSTSDVATTDADADSDGATSDATSRNLLQQLRQYALTQGIFAPSAQPGGAVSASA
jgi:hypothetical protein